MKRLHNDWARMESEMGEKSLNSLIDTTVAVAENANKENVDEMQQMIGKLKGSLEQLIDVSHHLNVEANLYRHVANDIV